MKYISISISEQTLELLENNNLVASYPISSAKNGIGYEEGSYQTPLGNFDIAEKHGDNAPIHTIFKNRKPLGIWSPNDSNNADLVLSRILWLQGLDPKNKNTKQRYIYIHGTNHEDLIGSPHSCGCIRMRNQDMIDLFNNVEAGTTVSISQ